MPAIAESGSLIMKSCRGICTIAAAVLFAVPSLFAATPARSPSALIAALSAAAPHADPGVIAIATRALQCATRSQLVERPRTLSVIDYSLPSTEPRLWVFDVANKRLLFRELVAHGRNSGANFATQFSDRPGSLKSSLGVFLTGDAYVGHNGYSLRLYGLEPGFNDNAYRRDIVIHGAAYVNASLAGSQGRIGRSFGCPALRPRIAHRLIDTIRAGSLIVAYYPDPRWLASSTFLQGCEVGDNPANTAVHSVASEHGLAARVN